MTSGLCIGQVISDHYLSITVEYYLILNKYINILKWHKNLHDDVGDLVVLNSMMVELVIIFFIRFLPYFAW